MEGREQRTVVRVHAKPTRAVKRARTCYSLFIFPCGGVFHVDVLGDKPVQFSSEL